MKCLMKLETSVLAACCSSLEGREGAGWMKEQRKCIAEQILEATELSEASCFHSTCPPPRNSSLQEESRERNIINGPTAQGVLERPFAGVLIVHGSLFWPAVKEISLLRH